MFLRAKKQCIENHFAGRSARATQSKANELRKALCALFCCGRLSTMRVMGIDCGTEYTGYGIVELCADAKLICVACGAIKLSPRDPMCARLSTIYSGLGEIIREHRPDNVAIEEIFYAINVKSALKLGQVRGVAMLAASSVGLTVSEYAPLTIKSAVVGYGRAEKHQVQHMVTQLLNLAEIPEPPDAADALAIAICHLHTAATLQAQVASAR
jgi:crossover junction endodeoxyribonuclease RuvC